MDLETSFGRWLRARRRALDLTQDDLARRVGCAVITIQKLEADERRPSRLLAERLADSLQIAADERAAIIRLARAEPYGDPAPAEAVEHHPPTPQRPPSNLPTPLTRLIGRKQDIAALRNALMRGEARLLTLIGPPGIGKTSLSIEVARDVYAAFTDGAYFVALAPIGEAALVLATIAQMLGIKETASLPLLDRLKAVLHTKRLLLVLDNFEHLLDAAPLVVELLEACPGLKALVTSRAALHVRGERLYTVPPLLLPDLAHRPASVTLARTPAVALFVERAQAVLPHFRLTAQNAAAVAAICVRLDGLPLAIELAATRIKLLPPEGLLARLEQRLALLTDGARDLPPRHQTLRAAIAWSHELLDAGEQTLFARLGVFVGGCTLAAAQAVAAELRIENEELRTAADDQTLFNSQFSILNLIESLLDKSLLKQEEGVAGEPRLTMLETIREYALERLEMRGEAEALRRRHAEYYVTLAEQAAPWLTHAERRPWLEHLGVEYTNLRAALAWACEQAAQNQMALQLAGDLTWFWYFRGEWSEGRSWLEKALAYSHMGGALDARAHTLDGAGWLASLQGDYVRAHVWLTESEALWRALDRPLHLARTQFFLGFTALGLGNIAEASARYEESIALCHDVDDRWVQDAHIDFDAALLIASLLCQPLCKI